MGDHDAAHAEALSAAAPDGVHDVAPAEVLSVASPVGDHDAAHAEVLSNVVPVGDHDVAPAEVLSAAAASATAATFATVVPLPTPEHATLQQAYDQLKAECKKRDEKLYYEYLNLQPKAWVKINDLVDA